MPQIINGKEISAGIKEELKAETAKLLEHGIEVCLTVIQVGDDPASSVYIRNKERACAYIGMKSQLYHLPEETTKEELLALIDRLNADAGVNGVLVQVPLPPHIDEKEVLERISPEKDVDCFHPYNVGNMCIGAPGPKPCTPAGIIELLKRSGIEIAGKECVIVGRSNIVGKPASLLFLQENATVTVAHSRTKDLKEVTRRADILITATGRAKFITKDYIKENAVVIDAGTSYDENGKFCGDVDFEDVYDHVSAITPVPGGVGPMTVTMLMDNCLETVRNR